MALAYIGKTRPTFDAGSGRMTYPVPTTVEVGDVLLAILVCSPAQNDAAIAAPGWSQIVAVGGAFAHVRIWSRFVAAGEPTTVDATTVAAVTFERIGALLHLRGGAGAIETSGVAELASTTAPATPATTSEQARNLQIAIITTTTDSPISGPSAWTELEHFTTLTLSRRRLRVVARRTGTGVIGAGTSTIAGAATSSFVWTGVLRDRAPFSPIGLVDLVPGNIGLLP